VFKGERCFGTVVAKMDVHRGKSLRGYIAMLTVLAEYRYLGVGACGWVGVDLAMGVGGPTCLCYAMWCWGSDSLLFPARQREHPACQVAAPLTTHPSCCLRAGSELVQRTIGAMVVGGCVEVALEAEVTNSGALRLYAKLGFIRDKRLARYYLSGSDAYRLKLLLPQPPGRRQELEAARQLQQLSLGEAGAPAPQEELPPWQPPGLEQHGGHDTQAVA
jgi:GNAT superfamily N-acetyltransferase